MSVRVVKNGQEYVIGGPGGDILPIGTIIDYNGQDVPEGWAVYSIENIEDMINNLKPHNYILKINEALPGGSVLTIPSNYIVGQNTLDVYLNGLKLICTTSSDTIGTNGKYIEVGNTDEISNQIQITTNWSLVSGDVFEFIIRGIY